MKIKRFNNYNKINEEITYIPVLDFIVSREGIPLIGENNLTKGKVSYTAGGIPDEIKNYNNDKEIAGVDKTGNLIVDPEYIRNKTFILDGVEHVARCVHYKDDFLEIPFDYFSKLIGLRGDLNKPFSKNVLNYWAIDYQDVNETNPPTKLDYTPLIPIIPTGWVNIKVDMEVSKRVKRYSEPLGIKSRNSHNYFLSKLKDLEKTSNSTRLLPSNTKIETIQKKMATIIILHYMNEIKDFFNSTQAGFLFESFISGLIPNSKVLDDNSSSDVVSDGLTYQMKLYSSKTNTIALKKVNGVLLNYYVIGLKYLGGIGVYVLNGNELLNPIDDYSFLTLAGNLKISNLEQIKNAPDSSYGSHRYIYMDLSDIDGRIDKIAKGLRETIKNLYINISTLEYNVETIVTGINEMGKRVEDINSVYDSTTQTIKNIEREILALNTRFNKR